MIDPLPTSVYEHVYVCLLVCSGRRYNFFTIVYKIAQLEPLNRLFYLIGHLLVTLYLSLIGDEKNAGF